MQWGGPVGCTRNGKTSASTSCFPIIYNPNCAEAIAMFSNWDTGIMQQQVWITLSILSPGIKYMLLVIAIFVCHVFFSHDCYPVRW